MSKVKSSRAKRKLPIKLITIIGLVVLIAAGAVLGYWLLKPAAVDDSQEKDKWGVTKQQRHDIDNVRTTYGKIVRFSGRSVTLDLPEDQGEGEFEISNETEFFKGDDYKNTYDRAVLKKGAQATILYDASNNELREIRVAE